jgi:hypothetical protein
MVADVRREVVVQRLSLLCLEPALVEGTELALGYFSAVHELLTSGALRRHPAVREERRPAA